jgi:PKD repeat protein
MKKILFSLFLLFLSIGVIAQDCTILSKANDISPDRLCSPVTVTWNVSYTGVNNAGTTVEILFNWDNGNIVTLPAIETAPGEFEATGVNTYTSAGNVCNYHPNATLIVNGVLCSSSTQEQIVTVWDDDDHNGGRMRINPVVYPICFGNSADVQFQDVTRFNCVPPQENDVPNIQTRWVQWIYGTDNTMSGIPVTINGNPAIFPDTAAIITLPGPVTGSGVLSDIINVADDKQIGEYWEITLRNWNYCNPYDDPNIPGPPIDTINGDNDPVETTAIILIVDYPDATINPVDTLCVTSSYETLTAATGGGNWSGNGVTGNRFYPNVAGVGTHEIIYNVTNSYGCTDVDTSEITVMPLPTVEIDTVFPLQINDPVYTLTATPSGGTFSGNGVSGNTFNPSLAGIGTHEITYTLPPDKYGCEGIDITYIEVVLPPIPVADWVPDTTGCTPLTVQFRNLSEGGESYIWDFGNGAFSEEENPLYTYYIPGIYLVKLTVTNIAGQDIHEGTISVYRNPIVIFDAYPINIVNNDQIVRFYNYTEHGFTYLWDFGDGETSNEFEPYHQYDNPGTYEVTLTVTSEDGCVDSLTLQTPIIVDFKEGHIRFANVFKWNGEGPTGGYWEENTNPDMDYVFRPHFENIEDYKLQIFNRWGVLVYESNDLYKGWDGYWKDGKLAQQGVYVWRVEGRYTNGEFFVKVGDVTFLH